MEIKLLQTTISYFSLLGAEKYKLDEKDLLNLIRNNSFPTDSSKKKLIIYYYKFNTTNLIIYI